MATLTPTPPARAGERSRSPSAQVEPVTGAIRAVRADELAEARDALADLRAALAEYFASIGDPIDFDAPIPTALPIVRKAIADRIEADIALLDLLDGDPDREDGGDLEPSLCGLTVSWPSPEDREMGDDNGIADEGGLFEQLKRHAARGGRAPGWTA
ncbi:hypothetical protein [Methylobacterium sp. JK268]